MTILIGIAGSFGSGKSEVTQIIKNIHGAHKVGELKFAQPLYDIQKWIQTYLEIKLHKDRNLLQLLGTEWGRKLDPDLWINEFLKSLNKYKDFYEVIICNDVRYPNEFKALKERGFILVKIERPVKDRVQFLAGGDANHSSETGLSEIPNEEFDYFIENNSTYDDFVYVISEMFIDIKESV